MYKKTLLLLSLVILTLIGMLSLTSVMAQDAPPTFTPAPTEDIPVEVQKALNYLGEILNYDRALRLTDILSYTYAVQDDKITGRCATDEPNLNNIIVTVTLFDPEGVIQEYRVRVATNTSLVQTCDIASYTTTPTPTVDLTQTTATPTFTPTFTLTPSLTYTPSNTFTPSLTPTNTLTPTTTLTPTNTPTLTPSLTPTPTYTFTPSVTPRSTDAVTCPGFLTSRLLIGERGLVIDGPLRLRSEPGIAGDPVALLENEAEFGVLEGPECDPDGDGRAWWKVTYSRFIGWLIEGEGENYYTEPLIGETFDTPTPVPATRTPVPTREGTQEIITCPGFMPSRLVIGLIGRVLPGDANNVRDIPAASGNLVGSIPGEGVFIVVDGPECDPAGRAWWLVDYDGIVGWTVEGQGEEYYLEPVTP